MKIYRLQIFTPFHIVTVASVLFMRIFEAFLYGYVFLKTQSVWLVAYGSALNTYLTVVMSAFYR
jgi:hypothetical protein